MLNFYSLYLCLPHCLSPFPLTVCLSVSLSLSLTLSLKLVLQHRDNYQLEALRQLNDREFYKPLSAPIYLQTAALIKRTVNNMRHQGFINKRQQHFLSPPSNPRPRHFYTLPKIHKSTDKWTVPGVIPPGRPIVSGCNSESANVEHFIDYHLQPIATSNSLFYPRQSTF